MARRLLKMLRQFSCFWNPILAWIFSRMRLIWKVWEISNFWKCHHRQTILRQIPKSLSELVRNRNKKWNLDKTYELICDRKFQFLLHFWILVESLVPARLKRKTQALKSSCCWCALRSTRSLQRHWWRRWLNW